MSDKKGLPSGAAEVVIDAHNYKHLEGIVLSLKKQGATAIYFSQVGFSSPSLESHSQLVSTQKMLPYLIKAVKTAQKEGLNFYLSNLPLCLLPGHEDHFIPPGVPGVKMQFCATCELSSRCGGISKAQLVAEYGTQLLSWQFLFPKDFFTDEDIAFLDDLLLKSAGKA